ERERLQLERALKYWDEWCESRVLPERGPEVGHRPFTREIRGQKISQQVLITNHRANYYAERKCSGLPSPLQRIFDYQPSEALKNGVQRCAQPERNDVGIECPFKRQPQNLWMLSEQRRQVCRKVLAGKAIEDFRR